jgi:hypothetical protein
MVLLVALFVGWVSPAALGAVDFQLVILMDGSSSIRGGDFSIEKDGIANAIREVVPVDGTIELTLVQFGFGVNGEAKIEVFPVVIDSSSKREDFAQRVQRVRKANGRTNIEAAIDMAMKALKGSAHFATAKRQLINIASDGKPNRPVGEKTGRQRALQARDRAVAAGLDHLSAEAIGRATGSGSEPDSLVGFLLDLAQPQESVFIEDFRNPPDTGGRGFVMKVETFEAIQKAFEIKLTIILTPAVANPGGPYFCQPDQTIRLNASGSRASGEDGKIEEYLWDFDGDGDFDDAEGVHASYRCGQSDATVSLKIVDSNNKSDTASTKVIIGYPPTIDIGGPYTCKENRTITLDASSSSDRDGQIVKFEWDFNNDDEPDATGATVQFTCPDVTDDSGAKIQLTVTDDDGLQTSKTFIVSVKANVASVADAGPNPNGNPNDSAYTCDPNQTITLNGSGSFDPDGTIAKYEWDLDGDDQYDDATGPSVSFTCPGASGLAIDNLISLRVTDDDGVETTDGGLLVVTRSCPSEGKPGEFYQTIKGLGHEYKDYIIFSLRNQLLAASFTLDGFEADPLDDDLSELAQELQELYPVMSSLEDYFHLITAFSTDLQCRVNAFRRNLQTRMDEGKFDSTFGKRIQKDLDALLDVFKRIDELLPAAIGQVDAADAALAAAIAAAEDEEPEGVNDALAEADKQLNKALNGVDRIRRKLLSEMLKRFKSIERVLEVAKRKGNSVSEPSIVLGLDQTLNQMSFIALGAGVSKINVQVFTLSGTNVFEQTKLGQQLAFNGRAANGQRLANGVYFYVITAMDARGQVLRSEVNKLVIAR